MDRRRDTPHNERRSPVAWAKVGVFAALLAVVSSGCLKPEDFPLEPRIEMGSFVQFRDSASVTISFTDGDGDIGLDPSDNQPPFDVGSAWYHNLFLEYEERRNGAWTRPQLLLPFHYRVPRITPSGRNKALRGDISVALKPWPVFPLPPGAPADTVRFSVKLVDRSLNESNTVYTDPVLVSR